MKELLAIRTGVRNTVAVILVIQDARLAELVASPLLLAQVWPGAFDEVMMLLQVLRMSVPSLAEALAVGLISMATPAVGTPSPLILLAYRSAVLRAVAGSKAGERIAAPCARPAEVRRLQVTDLVVAGQSGLRLAG